MIRSCSELLECFKRLKLLQFLKRNTNKLMEKVDQ